LPILRSLQILEQQQKPGLLKAIIGGVGDEVEGGGTLSDAMSKYRYVIFYVLRADEAFRAVTRAGTQEVLIVGFEQVDGFDFYGCGRELVKVKDGFFVFENFSVHIRQERSST